MVEFLDLSASICGTAGWITIDAGFWATSKMTVRQPFGDEAGNEVIETLWEGNGYVPMLRAVNEAIQAGLTEHPLHTTAHSVAVFETLDEIRRQITPA
jgi:hypothetical protein